MEGKQIMYVGVAFVFYLEKWVSWASQTQMAAEQVGG